MKKATCIVSLGLAVAVAIPLLAQAQTYANQPVGACPQLSYNLTVGSRDYYTRGQVTALQQFLATRYPGRQSVTGYYGSMTAGNVARLQQETSVYPATGGVGPLTRAAIARACGGGSSPGITFYLGTPFALSPGGSAKEYAGTLDITLMQINYISPSPAYYGAPGQLYSATVKLGASCPAGTYCATFYYPQQEFTLQPGQSASFQGYTVTLNHFATAAVFTVSKGQASSNLLVSAPQNGKTVQRGERLDIAWSGSAAQHGAAVVDLYTVAGSKVGTIAILSASALSTSWTVPTPATLCTLQYPNGLCGQNLSGQYFIKVAVVAGNGFDQNAQPLASANSGTFTVGAGQSQGVGTLTGRVTVAPTCPVEQYNGQCPPSAYQTTVDVYQNGAFKQTASTDLDGKYTLQLQAGTYELRTHGGQVYPICPVRSATVTSGSTATADITCDSGIR